MAYLLMESEAAAARRSREEALARGCAPGAVTQHWWSWVVDSETGTAVLIVGDDDPLRPGEVASGEEPDWLPEQP